jgi:hypothetical protein
MKNLLFIFAVFVSILPAFGQIAVNPTGVNVNSQNPTSVPLTFGPIPADYTQVEAIWCGELVQAIGAIGLQCRPDTIFGSLPLRYNLSQRRNINGNDFLYDVMAIPTSVARRAYQAAVGGQSAGFFYVRRFASSAGNPDIFVNVTCRMTGGGARVPFALTKVEIKTPTDKPVLFIESDAALPKINAEIVYNGTGVLKGRWELVKPGEEAPTDFDLLTEASIPVGERGRQKRYTEVLRFDVFLPPSGKYLLPAPRKLPTIVGGQYLLLLRIEVGEDKESENDLQILGVGGGKTQNGAAANFPMPTLKIFAGVMSDKLAWIKNGLITVLDKPQNSLNKNPQFAQQNVEAIKEDVRVFAWLALDEAEIYLLEVFDANESNLLSAYLPAPQLFYRLPLRFRDKFKNKQISWRMTALKKDGTAIARTETQKRN